MLEVSIASVRHVKPKNKFISGYDVEQRAKLLRFGAGRNVSGVDERALEELIADALKIEEAERRGYELAEAAVDDAFADVAKRNGISIERFVQALRGAGVDRATFEHKLRADLLWREAINRRYGARLQPNEDEIEIEMEALASQAGVKIYDVKQVVLPLSASAPQAQVRETFERAVRIQGEMNNCDRIARYARELGPPTGDIGRFTEEQMPAQLREQVLKLSPVQSSRPLRSSQGVHLIVLCSIEERRGGDRDQVEARLRQQKALRFSDSYLEELRRAATITQ